MPDCRTTSSVPDDVYSAVSVELAGSGNLFCQVSIGTLQAESQRVAEVRVTLTFTIEVP